MGTSFTANLFHINHSIYNNNIASEKANAEACNALTLRSQKERPEVPALKICFVTNKKRSICSDKGEIWRVQVYKKEAEIARKGRLIGKQEKLVCFDTGAQAGLMADRLLLQTSNTLRKY